MRFNILTLGLSVFVLGGFAIPVSNAGMMDQAKTMIFGEDEAVEKAKAAAAKAEYEKERFSNKNKQQKNEGVCDKYQGKVEKPEPFVFEDYTAGATPKGVIKEAAYNKIKKASDGKTTAKIIGKSECITAILNEADTEMKFNYMYPRRALQDENHNIRQKWVYMDWTEKRKAAKVKDGGVSKLTTQLTDMATSAAISLIKKNVGDKAAEAAQKLADASGTATQMVRLDSSADAYKAWYGQMLVKSNMPIHTLGQHLANAALAVSGQMLGKAIGGSGGALATNAMKNVKF